MERLPEAPQLVVQKNYAQVLQLGKLVVTGQQVKGIETSLKHKRRGKQNFLLN